MTAATKPAHDYAGTGTVLRDEPSLFAVAVPSSNRYRAPYEVHLTLDAGRWTGGWAHIGSCKTLAFHRRKTGPRTCEHYTEAVRVYRATHPKADAA